MTVRSWCECFEIEPHAPDLARLGRGTRRAFTQDMNSEYKVEGAARGDVTFVNAKDTLEAIARAGHTPESVYRVDLCWVEVRDGSRYDRYTKVFG